ncbi:hypothetical protein AB832_06795 [Flavobacteriaceae bacterium (ex Bugula neritina AB1)]|nr:hypothetical protein AB832_06795 [Flavobacteriaceae bacterium (ex Bugula neritina AB1)]
MPKILYNPGHVTYVQYYDSYLSAILPQALPRTGVLGPGSKGFWIRGKPQKLVEIPDDPLTIEISRSKFQTSDFAILNKLVISLQVSPKIDADIEVDDVEKYVAAYDLSVEELQSFGKSKHFEKAKTNAKNNRGDQEGQIESLLDVADSIRERKKRKARNWVSERLELLIEHVVSESFLSIVWANQTRESEAIIQFEVLMDELNKFQESKYQENKLLTHQEISSKTIPNTPQSTYRKVNQLIERIKKGESLSKLLEVKATEKLIEYNFLVTPGSLSIDIEYDTIGLDEKNPKHIPILEFQTLFNDFQERLFRLKEDFRIAMEEIALDYQEKEEEQKLKKEELTKQFEKEEDLLIKKYELESEEIKQEHTFQKRKLEAETKDYEQKVQAKINDFEKTLLDVERRRKELLIDRQRMEAEYEINELKTKVRYSQERANLEAEEVKIEEELVSNRKQKNVLDIDQLELEKDIKVAEIKKEVDIALSSLDERKRLPQNLTEIAYSADELLAQKSKEHEKELVKMQSDIHEMELQRKALENKLAYKQSLWPHEQKRELKLDELKFDLNKRIFEREILLAYSRIRMEDRNEYIKVLGEQMAAALGAASGMVDEFKVINTSGLNADGNSSIMGLISKLSDTLFKSGAALPAINEALKELGINWANKSAISGNSSNNVNPSLEENSIDLDLDLEHESLDLENKRESHSNVASQLENNAEEDDGDINLDI